MTTAICLLLAFGLMGAFFLVLKASHAGHEAVNAPLRRARQRTVDNLISNPEYRTLCSLVREFMLPHRLAGVEVARSHTRFLGLDDPRAMRPATRAALEVLHRAEVDYRHYGPKSFEEEFLYGSRAGRGLADARKAVKEAVIGDYGVDVPGTGVVITLDGFEAESG